MLERFFIKRLQKFKKPRKICNCFFVIGCSYILIVSTFFLSIKMPPGLIINFKYFVFLVLNLYLLISICRPIFIIFFRIFPIYQLCLVQVLENIRILLIQAIAQLFRILYSILLIQCWKVAKAFERPKGIIKDLYSPNFVINAVFYL